MINIIEELVGQTIIDILQETDKLVFFTKGLTFTFYHEQDCCEHVYIEDICGDLQDLTNSPLLTATFIVSKKDKDQCTDDLCEWTFYKFATINGFVDIRWSGESNGYYSVGVDLKIEKNDIL